MVSAFSAYTVPSTDQNTKVEEFDVIVLGAGISGIGAGCQLVREAPRKSFVILEAREEIGGTWSFFKYPGLRSDSDMYTLGYSFYPWHGKNSIATGEEIMEYLYEVIDYYGIKDQIRLQHKVVGLSWSSEEALWTVHVQVGSESFQRIYKAHYIFSSMGYYNYQQGHDPDFPGKDEFLGKIIHPQNWPQNYNYDGKDVIVIGSGATAITLIPSMIDRVKKLTMVQRSPTYILPVPWEDKLATKLYKYLPRKVAGRIIYTKNIIDGIKHYRKARKFPEMFRKTIADVNKMYLSDSCDMKHFTPRYDPWDQRLCADPAAGFLTAISSDKAEIVTDGVAYFDATGLTLESGRHISADIIVTATGLKLEFLSGCAITIDGKPLDIHKEITFLGAMLTNVPNFVFALGYPNASWTLKVSMAYDLLLAMIKKVDKTGSQYMVVRPDAGVKRSYFMDKLASGYVLRAVENMPHSGDRRPWKNHSNYVLDKLDYYRYKNLKSSEIELH